MFYLGFYVILVVCFCVELLMDDSVRTRYMGRDRPRFFDQVGHQTNNASLENKHFFTK